MKSPRSSSTISSKLKAPQAYPLSPMWRMYRDNTIQTMRDRHDNFNFSKVIRSHNKKTNLLQIGSFLRREPPRFAFCASPPRLPPSPDMMLTTSATQPVKPVLETSFRPQESLVAAAEQRPSYVASILGLNETLHPPEINPLQSYRNFKAKSLRPSTRGNLMVSSSQPLTSPTSPSYKPTTAYTSQPQHSSKTFNFDSFSTKNTVAQAFVNKLHLAEDPRLMSPSTGQRSTSRHSVLRAFQSIPEIHAAQHAPPRTASLAHRLRSLQSSEGHRPRTTARPQKAGIAATAGAGAAGRGRGEAGAQQHWVLAVAANMHIDDRFLRVAHLDINEFRKQMLPNKSAIIQNPRLKYLSYEQRLKLVEPSKQLVEQVFASVLESINTQLSVTERKRYDQELEAMRLAKQSVTKHQATSAAGAGAPLHTATPGKVVPEYKYIYRFEGPEVTKLSDIDDKCKILLVSEEPLEHPPSIEGLDKYLEEVPAMKREAVGKLFRSKFEGRPGSKEFFNPGFQLQPGVVLNQQLLCKIILKRLDDRQKSVKPAKRQTAGIRKQRILAAIEQAERAVGKDILKPQFSPNQLERRGLFDATEGLFKLQNPISWDVKGQQDVRSAARFRGKQRGRRSPSPSSMPRRKSSLGHGSLGYNSEEDGGGDLGFEQLRSFCEEFGLRRKDCFNIRSQFFSLVEMHQRSLALHRRHSSVASTHSDASEPLAEDLEWVPLDFFREHVTLFRFMLPTSIERILAALGLDIDNGKSKVTVAHYIELYCVVVLGNQPVSAQVAFWMKFFDPKGTGEVGRKEFFDAVEELVRGNVIIERQAATEQYARMVETRLAAYFDDDVLELEKVRRAMERGKVDVGILTSLLTGHSKEED